MRFGFRGFDEAIIESLVVIDQEFSSFAVLGLCPRTRFEGPWFGLLNTMQLSPRIQFRLPHSSIARKMPCTIRIQSR